MKLFSILIASTLIASSAAFSVAPGTARTSTRQYMFSGAGAGAPAEDDPDQLKLLEQTAKSMGMSVEEYKLGVAARNRLTNSMDAARISSGERGSVFCERDGHNPPKFLKITITEEGKALGKDRVSDALVSALKKSSAESKVKRAELQKDMMNFITEEMKKIGAA